MTPFRISALLFLLWASCQPTALSAAEKHYGKANVRSVTAVLDGDTFQVNIRNWPPIVGERISVRITGIDAPELNGRCPKERYLAKLAKKRLSDELKKAKRIELKRVKRDKYFRLNAEVYADEQNIADILVKANLAKRYLRGRKPNWCI